MYDKVPTNRNVVEHEKEVEKFWKEQDIFKKSMENRKEGETYTFYDGPPTANGKPHIGHVLTRVIKDMIPRYQTMKGKIVPRKAGWDTHGLPVELEVEKMLGLDGKEQIEEYGVEPFIQHCKESVWKYKGMWEDFSATLVYATLKGVSYSATAFAKGFGITLSVLGAALLVILSFLVAKRNYLPIQYLLNTVKASDQELEQSGVMDELGDLEIYVKKTIRTRQEMNEKIRQYEANMKELHLGQLLFQGGLPETEELKQELGFGGGFYAVLLCVFEETEVDSEALETVVQEADKREILMEYIQECFPELKQFYVLEGKDGFFCVLNGDSETGESFRQLLSGERDRMKEILAEEEKIFCNCYLSESGQSLEAVHKGYEEVRLKFVNKEIQDKTEENEICSIDRIMEIIRKNLSDENLSVNGIAEQVGVTPSHLSRYFKHQMGAGVLEYIHQSRVELAKDMLKNSPEVKIRDVAVRSGFCNITTFIRVFKKYEGMTPGQYRESLGAKTEV